MSKNDQRPHSLEEVALQGKTASERDAFLREFLDSFYAEPSSGRRQAMLAAIPPLLEDDRENAYLAAVAEHLALRFHLWPPEWVEHKSRFLKRAFFPCGLESLKATLLMESPPAFRRRLIFVGSDPLFRPRREQQGFSPHVE